MVTVAELGNEALDRWRTGSWRIVDTVQDIVNSLLWPAVIVALVRSGVV